MAAGHGSQFVLVERDGYSEDEVFEADSLEDIQEFLDSKSGRQR